MLVETLQTALVMIEEKYGKIIIPATTGKLFYKMSLQRKLNCLKNFLLSRNLHLNQKFLRQRNIVRTAEEEARVDNQKQ